MRFILSPSSAIVYTISSAVFANSFVDPLLSSSPLKSTRLVSLPKKRKLSSSSWSQSSSFYHSLRITNDDDETTTVPTSTSQEASSSKAKLLKEELFQMASDTKRGFSASKEEREKARTIIYDLAKYNPTKEPASSYYPSSSSSTTTRTLSGKWTLIYTDAPDITSLDPYTSSTTSSLPPSILPPTAKLGRIGQECSPPFIKNVIEWNRPDWIPDFIPSLLSTSNTILQKVVCEAEATPSNPMIVNLKLVGFDLQIPTNNSNNMDSSSSSSFPFANVLPNNNPLEIRGVITVPFGTFEILYLDEEVRIIKTGQNYLAVNVRQQQPNEEWF